MRHASWLIASSFFLWLSTGYAQQKPIELKATGWGSLSGKVTLDGAIPAVKPVGGVVPNVWVVDKKTKAVANVLVWLKPPKGTYLPIHGKLRQRKDPLVIEAKGMAFEPRISVHYPMYFDGRDEVPTGQKLVIKNSSLVAHNVRVMGARNGFNQTLPAKAEVEKVLETEKLPLTIQCDIHPRMGARMLVLDHPYYAVTRADGTFEMPLAPAGAEVRVFAWHEAVGYLLTSNGRSVTLKKDARTTLDFEVKP